MTAREDVTARLAAGLAAHLFTMRTQPNAEDPELIDYATACSCGAWTAFDHAGTHAAHVAAALAPTVEALVAEAYHEGYAEALSKPEIDLVRAKVLRDAADEWRRTWWDARPARLEDWLRARAALLADPATPEGRT